MAKQNGNGSSHAGEPRDLGLPYTKAMHGVQSAVAYEIGIGHTSDKTPKGLRVGVNAALVDGAALARLLIQKGVITIDEYAEAVRLQANEELAAYETRHGPGKRFR